MKQVVYIVKSNEQIAHRVWQMQLEGDTEGIRAGQFVNIQLDGQFLRRPISVNNIEGEVLTIIYKVVGQGTDKMSKMQAGQRLDVLTGLGNGYHIAMAGDKPLLVGGGVGVPPLFLLAKQLREQGKQVRVVLGFNTKNEVMLAEEFAALGCEVEVMTIDGSMGKKGLVTDALGEGYTYFYACGPIPMLRALHQATTSDGEMSLEERMGCGFGICVGCTQQTTNGLKRVCKEGPVFMKSDLIFA